MHFLSESTIYNLFILYTIQFKDVNRSQKKEKKKTLHVNSSPKRFGMATLTLNKIDFKSKLQ